MRSDAQVASLESEVAQICHAAYTQRMIGSFRLDIWNVAQDALPSNEDFSGWYFDDMWKTHYTIKDIVGTPYLAQSINKLVTLEEVAAVGEHTLRTDESDILFRTIMNKSGTRDDFYFEIQMKIRSSQEHADVINKHIHPLFWPEMESSNISVYVDKNSPTELTMLFTNDLRKSKRSMQESDSVLQQTQNLIYYFLAKLESYEDQI